MDSLFSRIAVAFCLFVQIALSHAETVYVQDTLRIGVRTEPSNSATPIGVVVTGMRLEIIEHSGDFVKIRTDKGLEGWIKESYVATDVPALIQLEALQKEYDQLKSRVGKHDDLLKSSEAANKTLSKELDDIRNENAELRLAVAKAKEQSVQQTGYYIWLILSYLVIGAIGVAAGVAWHRRQAMKRLGGLRV